MHLYTGAMTRDLMVEQPQMEWISALPTRKGSIQQSCMPLSMQKNRQHLNIPTFG